MVDDWASVRFHQKILSKRYILNYIRSACIASSVGLYYRLNLDDDVADQTWNIIPLTLTLWVILS